MTAPARVLTASRTLTAVKGKALYHDGIDDYVEVPDDPSLDITNAITIEAWVKPKISDSTLRPVVSKYQSSGNQRSWWLGCYSGSWRFYISQDGLNFKYVKASLSLNTWQHITAIFNPATGNDLFLYVNSVLKDSEDTDYSHLFSNDISVYIGEYNIGSGNNFNGTIALVRIYERALSAAEVLYNKEHPYNPVLHGCVLWLGYDSIDEAAGIWRDKSGYGNNGTIYGATAVEMNKLAGRVLSV